MRLLDALRTPKADYTSTRNAGSFGDWFRYAGNDYLSGSLAGSDPVIPDGTFREMVEKVHNENGPIASAVAARALLMSQVAFAWDDDQITGRLNLTRTAGLDPLHRPGSMARSQMMMRLEQDASYSGNGYLVRRRGQRVTYRLDPRRVTFAFGSNSDPDWDQESGEMLLPFDAEVVALAYNKSVAPGVSDYDVFWPGEFFHYAPEPDPLHWWRGASWITSLLRDVVSIEAQINDHQSKFFENAATPNMVLMMDPSKTPDEITAFRDVFTEAFGGHENAYKNWFLGGGTDVKVVGQDLSKLGLKDIQGGGETRVAMRSRVPAVILGAREGLSGSSLNAGNYNSARRLLADGWFSPTIDGLCQQAEAQRFVVPPPNKRLAHDPSAVLFLQEDRKDEAEINAAKVTSIRTLVDGGFDPAAAVSTLAPEWASSLKHTGKVSVQLQSPGAQARTVMGRLGRVDDPEMVDPDAVVDGVDGETATIVREALGAFDGGDMPELRAAILTALTEREL